MDVVLFYLFTQQKWELMGTFEEEKSKKKKNSNASFTIILQKKY